MPGFQHSGNDGILRRVTLSCVAEQEKTEMPAETLIDAKVGIRAAVELCPRPPRPHRAGRIAEQRGDDLVPRQPKSA
ncbi:hypothetical protein [Nonomuraea pusilla]|uniref:hypothetical protein n=1 Tax=Nonomuraea pusilla TaxID=46177 RepID=UPI001F368FDD|nr:hypothetical protein [Nonomuraea pusilla]